MNLNLYHYPQALVDEKLFYNSFDFNSYYQDMFVSTLYTTLSSMGHNVTLHRLYKNDDADYYFRDPSARTGINGPSNGFYKDIVIVESIDTNRYIVMDMRDCHGNPFSSDENCTGIFLTHFNRDDLERRYKQHSYKVFPFWFCDYNPNQTKKIRSKIQELLQLPKINKFMFSGTITGVTTENPYTYGDINIREVAIELDQKYNNIFYLQKKILFPDEFLLKSSRFKMALALPGNPWCSREHQLLSAGIPLLTYRWKSERIFPIIPELHYTSVEVEPRTVMGFPFNKEDGAKILAEKFIEVNDNAPLLSRRALAGQQHYDEYIYPVEFAKKFAPLILPLLK